MSSPDSEKKVFFVKIVWTRSGGSFSGIFREISGFTDCIPVLSCYIEPVNRLKLEFGSNE